MTASIIIPAFNPDLSHFSECLISVQNQTYGDIEVIIVDDGSRKALKNEWLKQSLQRPFHLHRLQSNQGLPTALNVGLSLSTGNFIARMDADDIMHPERIRKQIQFLTDHPNCDVVGSYAQHFDRSRRLVQVPTDASDIAWRALFNNPMVHPSVMMRYEGSSDIQYRDDVQSAEDYLFWLDHMNRGRQFANLKEPLIRYRVHGSNSSATTRSIRGKRHQEVYFELNRLFFDDDPDFKEIIELGIHNQIAGNPVVDHIPLSTSSRKHYLNTLKRCTAMREDIFGKGMPWGFLRMLLVLNKSKVGSKISKTLLRP